MKLSRVKAPFMAFYLLIYVIGNHFSVGRRINRADALEEGRTDRGFDPGLEVLPATLQMLINFFLVSALCVR